MSKSQVQLLPVTKANSIAVVGVLMLTVAGCGKTTGIMNLAAGHPIQAEGIRDGSPQQIFW
jgi:hypothetical protein